MEYRDDDERRFLTPDDPVGALVDRLLYPARFDGPLEGCRWAIVAVFGWRAGAVDGARSAAVEATRLDPRWAELVSALTRSAGSHDLYATESAVLVPGWNRGRDRIELRVTCRRCEEEFRGEAQSMEEARAFTLAYLNNDRIKGDLADLVEAPPCRGPKPPRRARLLGEKSSFEDSLEPFRTARERFSDE